MIRKFTALLAALAFGMTTLAAPAYAERRHHDGYYGGRGDYGRHHYRGYRHRDHDRGDAVAAGAVGLILGLAIGSLASQPNQPQSRCYDNYRRCAAPPPPPPRCNSRCGDGYYDDGYYNAPSAYEDDYGLEGRQYEDDRYAGPPPSSQRMCRERQWDRYAQRYLMVDVPC